MPGSARFSKNINKYMKTKLFTLLFAVAASVGTMCASTKIGDLYYNLDTINLTAEVTYESDIWIGNYDYLDDAITIPEFVTCEGRTYSVTSIGSCAFRREYYQYLIVLSRTERKIFSALLYSATTSLIISPLFISSFLTNT